MKKAQASTEFLMTYGWAILLVLLGVGTLTYSGVFNMNKFLPEECNIYAGSTLACEDFVIDGNTKVIIKLKNMLDDDITVNSATLKSKEGLDLCTSGPVNLEGGTSEPIILTCTELPSRVKGTLSIDYLVSGSNKVASGSLVGYAFGGTLAPTPSPSPSPSPTPSSSPSPTPSSSPTPSPS